MIFRPETDDSSTEGLHYRQMLVDGVPDGRFTICNGDGVCCFLELWNGAGDVCEELVMGMRKFPFVNQIASWSLGEDSETMEWHRTGGQTGRNL